MARALASEQRFMGGFVLEGPPVPAPPAPSGPPKFSYMVGWLYSNGLPPSVLVPLLWRPSTAAAAAGTVSHPPNQWTIGSPALTPIQQLSGPMPRRFRGASRREVVIWLSRTCPTLCALLGALPGRHARLYASCVSVQQCSYAGHVSWAMFVVCSGWLPSPVRAI